MRELHFSPAALTAAGDDRRPVVPDPPEHTAASAAAPLECCLPLLFSRLSARRFCAPAQLLLRPSFIRLLLLQSQSELPITHQIACHGDLSFWMFRAHRPDLSERLGMTALDTPSAEKIQ
jgi:hypothetical protein